MLALFTNRIAVTQFAGLALAALAAFHIILPPHADASHVVAAVLLAASAISAVQRFGHAGAPGAEAKAWWQSRTIWTQIIGAVSAIAALAGFVPAADQEDLVEAAMAIVGAISMMLGRGIVRPIALPVRTVAGSVLAVVGTLGTLLILGGCGIAGIQSSGSIAAVTEAGVAGDMNLIAARMEAGEITAGASAARALRRLDTEYAALCIARAAFDSTEIASGHTTPPAVIAARDAADQAYALLRARLAALVDG